MDKDDIPLLGGQYVLGYYSTNMQSIIGLSANFQVNVAHLLYSSLECVVYSKISFLVNLADLGVETCRHGGARAGQHQWAHQIIEETLMCLISLKLDL